MSLKIAVAASTGWTRPTTAFYKSTDTGLFYSDEECTTEITSISVPTKVNCTFGGCWSTNAETGGYQYIDADGKFTDAFYSASITANKVIYIREANFGQVTDWFGLSSATLVPESSDSGDTHEHTCAYNATKSSTSADNVVATSTSGIWRNPRVTYRVVGQMTLSVTLGKAFDDSSSVSGYMISSVEVSTVIGEAPTVTVSGVANEGVKAVKTYSVSVAISPRHRPQNLLSAISGGGELQSLTLVARGDPVVVAENGMPCASDMTHGRIEVSAITAAYNGESAPTAGTNFTKTAEPVARNGIGYKTYNVTVRKELT